MDEQHDDNQLESSIGDDSLQRQDSTNAGRWTSEEHQRFLEALKIYGKNWNLVHKFVGSRSSA